MARSRTIKPAFFLNENLAALSLTARLLFIGLWTLADCKGRLEDRPMRIRGALFPYEHVDADVLLNELANAPEKFIIRYSVGGKNYIEIPGFSKHQNPSTKEKQSGSQIPPHPLGDTLGSEPGRNGVVPGTCPAPPITYYSLPSTPSLTLQPEPDASTSVCVIVSDENKKFAEEGMNYLLSLNSPNHSNPLWVKGYLGIQLQALERTRPNLKKPEILSVWRDTCDLAVNQSKTAPNWLKSVFKNKIDSLTAEASKTFLPGRTSNQALAEQTKVLMEFPFVRHIVTGETFQAENMEIRPDAPNGLTDQHGNYYPVGQLEGLQETPADA